MTQTPRDTFRPVPRTGVIYVMTEAAAAGYDPNDPRWANLGQGAPETGPIEGAPERIQTITLTDDDHEYAPVDGLPALKQAVADLYNARFRKGRSQYTADHVAISPGGRAGLTRLAATLGRTHVGHLLPDYTAYEELLDAFGTFVPMPIPLAPSDGRALDAARLRDEVLDRGLSAVLLSNPCNPTGRLLAGEALHDLVDTARALDCALILDEFYAHYGWTDDGLPVSAAAYVDDVDRDPILVVDGLTKNWRYPGWRVSWTLGPPDLIDRVASAGSFLDGGCARPMQLAAVPLLDPAVADAEAAAIQGTFRHKRDLLVEGLRRLGVRIDHVPEGGFYVWGELSGLPDGLDTGMGLFRAALDERVILVPGEFFDVNPGRRRPDRPGRFQRYARFSFGPSEQTLRTGLEGLTRLVARAMRADVPA